MSGSAGAASARAPRIAIVGAGIGGLAAAAFLSRAGLASTVYEQAPELTEVGAGLVVAPNAARLLRRLGVLAQFQDRAGIEVRQPPLQLQFSDGPVAEADVVIGADGIHSVIREALTGSSAAEYAGICAFRALVPAGQAPAFALRPAQTLWLGPGRHLVHYPVSAGRYVNLVAFAPAEGYGVESWTATATAGEFLAEFTGWDHRLTDLIQAGGRPGRWALLDRAPLPRWTQGQITLLGDAAHPMFPLFAQGAAEAIEDAAVLARCLAGDVAEPAAALQRYEALRIPRTTRLQQVSHARAQVNHLPDGPQQRARDDALASMDPLAANGWIYGFDPEETLPGPAADSPPTE